MPCSSPVWMCWTRRLRPASTPPAAFMRRPRGYWAWPRPDSVKAGPVSASASRWGNAVWARCWWPEPTAGCVRSGWATIRRPCYVSCRNASRGSVWSVPMPSSSAGWPRSWGWWRRRESSARCRWTFAGRCSSSGYGRRCAPSRPGRPCTMPSSPRRSGGPARCGRWRRRAPPIRWRWRFPATGWFAATVPWRDIAGGGAQGGVAGARSGRALTSRPESLRPRRGSCRDGALGHRRHAARRCRSRPP